MREKTTPIRVYEILLVALRSFLCTHSLLPRDSRFTFDARDVIRLKHVVGKMSATETRDTSVSKIKEKLPAHQLNPSYTVRVICCVLFIFLTEIFLAHYVYRLINSEIRQDYITRDSFQRNFLDGIRGEEFRDEVKRIIRDYEFAKADGIVKSATKEDVRVKRNVKHRVDYNYLSVQAEDPQERLRDGLEDPDRGMRTDGEKIDNDNGDWIWITSSSRIPVRNQ